MSPRWLVGRSVASRTLPGLVAALALTVPATVVAQTPFGDDLGTISAAVPKGRITKCDEGVAKATAAKVALGLSESHSGRASGKVPDEATGTTCGSTAKTKAEATNIAGCLLCASVESRLQVLMPSRRRSRT